MSLATMEGFMDKILHNIPTESDFILEEDSELYVHCRGEGEVFVDRVEHYAPDREFGYLSPGIEKLITIDSQKHTGVLDLPKNIHLRLRTMGQILAFELRDDPTYTFVPYAQPEPLYEVLGQTQVSGGQSWVSDPFLLTNIKGGRFTLQLYEAWRCDAPHGYGNLYVETSDDKERWEVFENFGLSNGMCTISQHGAKAGDLYEDEFYFTNPGTYARIVYDACRTFGEAYRATLTVETSQHGTHGKARR